MKKRLFLSTRNHLLTAFIPWIFFALFYRGQGPANIWASLGAALLMIGFNGRELRKRFILPWGSLLFFVLLALNNALSLWVWAKMHAFQIVNSTLAAIVLISMAIGQPFTLQYAREEAPREKWSHPLFLKINWILTSIWAVLMIIMAIPSYILTEEAIQASWFFNYGLSIICIVLGLRCNKWIPAYLRRKTR